MLAQGSGVVAQQSEDCDVCHGSGEILRTRYNHSGFKAIHVGVCPACGGNGSKSRVLCSRCGQKRLCSRVLWSWCSGDVRIRQDMRLGAAEILESNMV